MSFLGDIVNSIGTGAAPPPKPAGRLPGVNSQQRTAEDLKPGSRPGVTSTPSPLNGSKRRAEDEPPKATYKIIRPNPTPGLTSSVSKRTSAPLNAPKPAGDKHASVARPKLETSVSASRTASASPTTPATAVSKAPPKGSYADIMARAKQAQEMKAHSQIGLIKHQATNRERVSKVAERRRQEEEKTKAAKDKSGARPVAGKLGKSRSASPAKKSDQPRVPKAPRPPLHAPASYKGTIGTASTREKQQSQRRRKQYDEYLGTDEEDASDDVGYGQDEEDDYGSDASSVMEAGAFEVDEEEQRALRAAKEEDAKELALEAQLKREKEERRRKLMILASKRK
ncbi:hypothetical protein A1O3_03924 [Capronia epimyces CBS 606.96]|uniref:SPT2 chromatin protein n=1 Tax=Capronia epimyces CBS 606.96 TaxID=1182542 RepID=W9YBF1_9EURO|nr:uncharacterized protein A1O3_03924 [Capronia epimyces CBS 606.96]EXJ86970.1 hypothetical protein A1O3_03924 [Capronia epimyces CBS 606.96]